MALLDLQNKKVFVHEGENEEDAAAALQVAGAYGHSQNDFTVVYEGRVTPALLEQFKAYLTVMKENPDANFLAYLAEDGVHLAVGSFHNIFDKAHEQSGGNWGLLIHTMRSMDIGTGEIRRIHYTTVADEEGRSVLESLDSLDDARLTRILDDGFAQLRKEGKWKER
jgi:hypothetical protein